MSKNSIVISCLMLFLAACGGDGSSSVTANDEPVSVENSSSSEKLSSSSVILSASEESSSSLAKSSSSSKVTDKVGEPAEPAEETSSRSEKAKSSSSKEEKETKESSSSAKSSSSSSVILSASEESSSSSAKSSSSSASLPNCSALLEGETGWNWNVPKECRFNLEIDYGTMTDERDGKVYRTVKIGDQTWMAENLNYYKDTDLNVKEKSWCYGKKDNGDSTTCDVAGRLYTWAAAMDSVKLANDADNPQDCGYGKECGVASTRSATLVQGVCPTGWHLPSRAEWNSLFTAVGDESIAGKVLKSQTGWYNSGNGTDAFGFSALPAGGRNGDGEGYNEGDYAYFWSSTELNSSYAYRMYLGYADVDATLSYKNKDDGFSVRCVKD